MKDTTKKATKGSKQRRGAKKPAAPKLSPQAARARRIDFEAELFARTATHEKATPEARGAVVSLMASLMVKQREMNREQTHALLLDPAFIRALYPHLCAAFPNETNDAFGLMLDNLERVPGLLDAIQEAKAEHEQSRDDLATMIAAVVAHPDTPAELKEHMESGLDEVFNNLGKPSNFTTTPAYIAALIAHANEAEKGGRADV